MYIRNGGIMFWVWVLVNVVQLQQKLARQQADLTKLQEELSRTGDETQRTALLQKIEAIKKGEIVLDAGAKTLKR